MFEFDFFNVLGYMTFYVIFACIVTSLIIFICYLIVVMDIEMDNNRKEQNRKRKD